MRANSKHLYIPMISFTSHFSLLFFARYFSYCVNHVVPLHRNCCWWALSFLSSAPSAIISFSFLVMFLSGNSPFSPCRKKGRFWLECGFLINFSSFWILGPSWNLALLLDSHDARAANVVVVPVEILKIFSFTGTSEQHAFVLFVILCMDFSLKMKSPLVAEQCREENNIVPRQCSAAFSFWLIITLIRRNLEFRLRRG